MDKNKALAQAMEYCAKSERSIKETRNFLIKSGVREEEIDRIISQLIREGFINELRYAQSFVSDKYRFNSWGRTKIRYQLSAKGISSNIIDEALESLDPDEYYDKLKEQLQKKLTTIKGGSYYEKKAKLMRFAAGRGYESDIIYDAIDELLRT